MMDGRCGTCKWWGHGGEVQCPKARELHPEYKLCGHLMCCEWSQIDAVDRMYVSKIGAEVGDFATGPDFGCVNHDPPQARKADKTPGRVALPGCICGCNVAPWTSHG